MPKGKPKTVAGQLVSDAVRWAGMKKQTQERKRAEEAAGGPRYDLGGGLEGTKEEAVALFTGAPGVEQALAERSGVAGSGYGGQPDTDYDTTRFGRDGRLSDQQYTSLYVYQAPHEVGFWRNSDGSWNNTLQERTFQMYRNANAALAVMPELERNPLALSRLIAEPYLDQRLQGMAKARDWLSLRAEVASMQSLSPEAQAQWWSQLGETKQRAYRKAGYRSPEEIKAQMAGIGAGMSLSPLRTAGEYIGLDSVVDAGKWMLAGPSEGVSTLIDVAMWGSDRVGQFTRTFDAIQRGDTPSGDSGWSNWWTTWNQAENGERFIAKSKLDEALEMAEGDRDRLDLWLRLSAGETLEDIAADVADVGTTQFSDTYAALQRFANDSRTQAGLAVLEEGKYSAGRDLAYDLGLDYGSAPYTIVSGAGDATWLLVADPTLLLGKASKINILAKRGLLALDEANQATRMAEILRTADSGKDVAAVVRGARGGQEVTRFGTAEYLLGLGRLKVSAQQRPWVALSDAVNASRNGDTEALGWWAKQFPAGRNIMGSFLRYLDEVVPRLPDGRLAEEITFEHAAGFLLKPPRSVDIDDVLDYARDTSGIAAIMRGEWGAVGQAHFVMPTLNRLGTAKVLTKLAMNKVIDFTDNVVVQMQARAGFSLAEHEDPEHFVRLVRDAMESSAMRDVNDEMRAIQIALQEQGFDAETVVRTVERQVAQLTQVGKNPGESARSAILRGIVSAQNEAEAQKIRDLWRLAFENQIGVEGSAMLDLDLVEDLYRRALGLTDSGPQLIRRTFELNEAVNLAARATYSRGETKAWERYAQALRNAGTDDAEIALTKRFFDAQVDLRRAEIRAETASAASPDIEELAARFVGLPLTRVLTSPVRFLENLAKQVPKEGYMLLDGPNTPVVLEQMLDFNVRGPAARELYGRFLEGNEATRRMVVKDIYRAIFDRMGILHDPDHAPFVQEWLSSANQRYGLNDLVHTAAGSHAAAILPEAHVSSAIAIPRFREIDAQIKRSRLMGYINGAGNKVLGVNSAAADTFMRTWRLAVVMRPAMIPRAGGEELLAAYARFGPGFLAKQQVVARALASKGADLVRSRLSALSGRLYDDAAETTLDLSELVPEGGRLRNFIQAFSLKNQSVLRAFAGRALTPDEIHAMDMLSVSTVAQRAMEETSGLNHGLTVTARKLDEDLTSHGPRLGRFEVGLVDARTGEPMVMNLKADSGYSTFTPDDPFFRQRLSGNAAALASDQAGRLAVAVDALDLGPIQADRMYGLISANINLHGETSYETVNLVRTMVQALPSETRTKLERWLYETRGEMPEGLFDNKALRAMFESLRPWLDDDALRALSIDEDTMRAMFNELEYGDRVALLVATPDLGGIDIGWLDQLTEPGIMYRGTGLETGDNYTLWGEPGQQFSNITPYITAHGFSGPGVYVTNAGEYAEVFASSAHMDRSKITKLRWRKGSPPQLLDGASMDNMTEMGQMLDQVQVDLFRSLLPGDLGEAAATVFSERLSVREAVDLAADLGLDEADTRLLRFMADRIEEVPLYQAGVFEADSLSRMVSNGKKRADLWLEMIMKRAASEGLGPLEDITVGIDRVKSAYPRHYLEAYNRRVVEPWTKRGYRGISDHGTTPDHFPAVIWHPMDLQVVGEIPYRGSLMHDLLTRQKLNDRQDIRLAMAETDPDLRRERLRQVAIEMVRSRLMEPSYQPRLARMDRMSRVADPVPKGHIRLYVPLMPASTRRALAEVARASEATKSISSVTSMTGVPLERAHTLGITMSSEHRAFFEDLLARDVPDTIFDAAPLPGRLVTSDPRMADQIEERIRGLSRFIGLDDATANTIRMGYIDLTKTEFARLPSAVPGGTLRSPEEAAAALRQGQTAYVVPGTASGTARALIDNPQGLPTSSGGSFPVPYSAEANRPVTGVGPLHWIDDDMVLNRAQGYVERELVLEDLDDRARAHLADAVDTLRQRASQRLGPYVDSPRLSPMVPTSRIANDAELIGEMRALVGHIKLPQGFTQSDLYSFLTDPDPDARQLWLESLGQDADGRIQRALSMLPNSVIHLIFEGPVAGVLEANWVLGAGRWSYSEGKSWFKAVDDLAESIVDLSRETTRRPNGDPIHAIMQPVSTGTWNAAKHMTGRDLGELPLLITGPNLSTRAEASAARTLSDSAMQMISRGIDQLVRTPLYRQEFATRLPEAYKILRPLMTDPVHASRASQHVDNLAEAGDRLYETTAALSGAGHQITDWEIIETLIEGGYYNPAENLHVWLKDSEGRIKRVLKRDELNTAEKEIIKWWKGEKIMRDEALQIASVSSTEALIPFIDDHRVRSQFAEKMRNVIPFLFAEEQFYKRWARTFVHSPESFRYLSLAHNAVRSVGWVEETEFGEEVMMYPGAQYVGRALAQFLEVLPTDSKWTLPITPMLTGQLQYAAPGFDRIGVPSAGPIAAIPMRVLRSVLPEVSPTLEEAILGERGVGRSLPESVLPSVLYKIYKFGSMTNEEMSSATISAIQMMEATHPELVPSADASAADVDTYIERLRNHARVITLTKALLGFVLPAAPAVDYDPDNLSQEFLGYLKADVPIEEAVANFLRDNPDATPYTLFDTSSPSKASIDPTEETYRMIRENDAFYDAYPSSGAWLLPAAGPDDPFDRQAWHELLAHKMRTRKTDMEFYRSLKYAEAAEIYFDSQASKNAALEAAATTLERKAIADSWTEWSDEFLKKHRIFRDDLQSRASHNRRQAVLDEIENALADPRRPDVEHAEALSELVASYRAYAKYKRDTVNDDRTITRNARKAATESFIEWAEEFSAVHPTVRLFWRRIILPEVDSGRGYAAETSATTESAA